MKVCNDDTFATSPVPAATGSLSPPSSTFEPEPRLLLVVVPYPHKSTVAASKSWNWSRLRPRLPSSTTPKMSLSTVSSPATFALAVPPAHRFFQPAARPRVVPDSSSVARGGRSRGRSKLCGGPAPSCGPSHLPRVFAGSAGSASTADSNDQLILDLRFLCFRRAVPDHIVTPMTGSPDHLITFLPITFPHCRDV